MRVVRNVFSRVDATHRHTGGVQHLQHLRHRALRRPRPDGCIDLGHTPDAPRVRRQFGIGGQVIPSDGDHQALEDGVAIAANHHHAIGTRVSVAGRDTRQGRASRLAHRPESTVLRQQAFHAVEHGLVQGHVHHLATAFRRLGADAGVAGLQGQQHADHPMQRGQGVSQADTGPHGRTAWLAIEVTHAAHGLGHHGKPWSVFVGAALAVAADAQHDEAGVARAELLVAHAPLLHGAGLEVLDQHIGFIDEAAHQLAPFGRAQVQHHALFVAALHLPPHAGAVVQHAPLAQRVSTGRSLGGRWLDLDDLGTKIGQGLARKGARDQLAQFKHLQARQGLRRNGGDGSGAVHGTAW